MHEVWYVGEAEGAEVLEDGVAEGAELFPVCVAEAECGAEIYTFLGRPWDTDFEEGMEEGGGE